MSGEDRSQRVRKSLADARLVEIEPEEFPDRIRVVKRVAIGRLGELLEKDSGMQEPRSVAHSLGTLTRLEATLRVDAAQHEPEQIGEPARPKPADG